MGFMTILRGDDRFYNNIFVQKYPSAAVDVRGDHDEAEYENREVGTHVLDEYVTHDEWISWFDLDGDTPDMMALEPYHWRPLPVWVEGNASLGGAQSYKKEKIASSTRPTK